MVGGVHIQNIFRWLGKWELRNEVVAPYPYIPDVNDLQCSDPDRGDSVRVINSFPRYSNRSTLIPNGTTGTVLGLDSLGDMFVRFHGIGVNASNETEWVEGHDFKNVAGISRVSKGTPSRR